MKAIIILFTVVLLAGSQQTFAQQPPHFEGKIQQLGNTLNNSTYLKVPSPDGLYHDILKRQEDRMNVFPFRQTLTLSVGYSSIQQTTNKFIAYRQGEDEFSFGANYQQPLFKFKHEIYWGPIFSTAYSVGYGSNKVYMNDQQIASKNIMAFVHPKLNYFRSTKVEAYFQLNVGLVYNDMDISSITNETIARNVPSNFKMYTGFTPLGLNFLINERIALNTEFSLWSFETVSVGLKYKFNRNVYRKEMYEDRLYRRAGY